MRCRENQGVGKLLFHFGTDGAVQGWNPVDDRVMGGASRSALRHDPAGHASFQGEVSLARNGGFASVRSPAVPMGPAGAHDCLIEARGDGRAYKLNLITDEGLDALAYQATWTPAAGEWRTVVLPLAGFQATFRGRKVAGSAPLDVTRLRQIGLVIGDRQAGPFRLDLRSIGFD
jgi:hypothetical protein